MEGDYPANWIHSGQYSTGKWYDWAYHGSTGGQDGAEDEYAKWRTEDMCMIVGAGVLNDSDPERVFKDPNQQFESVLNGTWSPYVLSSPYDGGPQAKYDFPDDVYFEAGRFPQPSAFDFWNFTAVPRRAGYNQTMTNLYSVDVVLTPDRSKWTRAIVLEGGSAPESQNYLVNQEFHGATYRNVHLEPKKCPSVDKDGNPEANPVAGQETGLPIRILFRELLRMFSIMVPNGKTPTV